MRFVPGFRTTLPPQIQWQPTLTSHDPNPPIPINEGSSPVSGSAAQTLADVSQSATGTLLIQGTAGQTLADVVQAATGTLLIQGSAAQTLDSVSQSATGTNDSPVVVATPDAGNGVAGGLKKRRRRRKARYEFVDTGGDGGPPAFERSFPEDEEATVSPPVIAPDESLPPQTIAALTNESLEARAESIRILQRMEQATRAAAERVRLRKLEEDEDDVLLLLAA